MKDQRPPLNKDISVDDFKSFYWLKNELYVFCKSHNLHRSGSKIELSNIIEQFLIDGTIPKVKTKLKAHSKFDWNEATLTTETVITDSYKSSENVRAFFKRSIGDKFKFSVGLVDWIKNNQGKNLGDAIEYYHQLKQKKSDGSEKIIKKQFEYNTYIRDFLKANSTLSKASAIKCWNIKRNLRGTNKYESSDLNWIKD